MPVRHHFLARAQWARAIEEATNHHWVLAPRNPNAPRGDEVPVVMELVKTRDGGLGKFDLFWWPAIYRFFGESQMPREGSGGPASRREPEYANQKAAAK